MKVCILGEGLTSLTLAKALINQGIYVDIFSNQKFKQKQKSRTLGISKSNIKFFNENILNIEKLLWNIEKIEIYSESLNNEKVLNFKNNNQRLFSMVRNDKLNDYLLLKIKKSKLIKFKKTKDDYDSLKDNYKIIFNLDSNNQIAKKYFYKKFTKNYSSYAHIAIIKHKKDSQNHSACQIFTKRGPLAFLPLSSEETSVVFSARGNKAVELESVIRKYNFKYKILKINDIKSFELKSRDLRSYHHKNILAFGDLLHRLHPLAGQGFNMTIRDISELMSLIKFKIQHGLDLDNSICVDFEKNLRHKNFLFTNGIDFIYEFFNFETKINKNILSKSVKILGKNKIANKFLTKFADYGLKI